MTHIPENMAKVVHQHNCRRTRITGKGISFTGGNRGRSGRVFGEASEELGSGFGESTWF